MYPHYVNKVEKKGRTTSELDQVIAWLTGFDEATLQQHLTSGTTFEDFFAAAQLNPLASSITGTICGIRVESIEDPADAEDPLLDKLVDQLAKRARRWTRSSAPSPTAPSPTAPRLDGGH